jgi:uncharacterized RDD family membrane protein YckC
VRLFLGRHAFVGQDLILARCAAFTIDAALLVLTVMLTLLALVPVQTFDPANVVAVWIDQLNASEATTTSTALLVWGYGVLGYFAICTWTFRGTLGQLAIGLRVVQIDYRRASLGQCVGRALLSTLVILTYGAGFLIAIRGPGYRAVHDHLSGTIVVRARSLK